MCVCVLAGCGRTHQRIVDLAHHGAISLLLHWFPESLDKLQREHSAISGDLPILLTPDGADWETDLIAMLFGDPGTQQAGSPGSEARGRETACGDGAAQGAGEEVAGGSPVQFGADQTILVYDEARREQVQALVGDSALVLTVQQCKGLEFEVRAAPGSPSLRLCQNSTMIMM